jgi:iron complex outermembrane receptor protein
MKIVMISFLILLLAFSQVSLAEEQEKESPIKLDEVVVTASRTEKKLGDAPASVDVITAKEISRTNVKGIDEVVRTVAGVYNKRSKGFAETMPTISLRGFYGPERNLVLINGMPSPPGWGWSRVPLEMIDKVEVVKGPFSALYGERAMGGVVNILTKAAKEAKLSAKATAEENNTRVYEFAYGNKYKGLSYLLNVTRRETDGYPSNFLTCKEYTGKQEVTAEVTNFKKTRDRKGGTVYLIGDMGRNWYEDESYNLKLNWEINPASSVDLNLTHGDYDYGYREGESYLRNVTDESIVRDGIVKLQGTDTKLSVSGTSFLSSYGGEPVDSVTSSYNQKIGENISLTALLGWDKIDHWWADPTKKFSSSPEENIRASLMSNFRIGEKNLLTLGVDARSGKSSSEKWNLDDWQDINSKTTLDITTEGKARTIGLYLQNETAITEQLKCFVGGRYDFWQSYDGYNKRKDAKKNKYIAENFDEKSEGAFSPKAAVVFKPINGTTLRASVGSAFRGPVTDDLYKSWFYLGRLYLCNPDLGTENTLSSEVGIDQSLLDKVLIKSACFYNRMEELIQYKTFSEDEVKKYNAEHGADYTAIKKKENVAKARSQGFEIGVSGNIFANLSAFANYTYTDTEVLENPANPDSVGKRLTSIPRDTYNIGLDFLHSGFSAYVVGRYVGKVYNEDDNSDAETGVYGGYDPFFVVDMKFSYQLDPSAKIAFSVDNLFDEEYYQYYKSPGRTLGLQLSKEF